MTRQIDHSAGACRGKVCYRTFGEAVAAITSIRAKFGRTGSLHGYRCPDGPHFHVGRKPVAFIEIRDGLKARRRERKHSMTDDDL